MKNIRRRSRLALLLGSALFGALYTPGAHANGVSDGRVSLPDGPGSIQGIGANMNINPNMGMMSYSVPFELPAGHAGATPSLGLSYSSGNGGSVVGVGWDIGLSSIERSIKRGLPEYDTDDEFAADGGTELVRVSDGVYRARMEGGFARYNWLAAGDGSGGYWLVESPDGGKSYYGATSEGTLVPSARAEEGGKTFRYHLVETVDVYGHQVVYEYDKFAGNEPMLTAIEYVFTGGEARYRVELEYERRDDPTTTGTPGFLLESGYRLTGVTTKSHGTTLKSWGLGYEPYSESGGATRLSSVTAYGANGGKYPAVESFEYAQSLGNLCTGAGCAKPFLASMGKPSSAAGMTTGQATLVDINGDGLPDLVGSTATGGAHRIHINSLDDDYQPMFDADGVDSAIADASEDWDFAHPHIQAIDINGDGLTDVYNRTLGQALCNDGSGDWSPGAECAQSGGDVASDFVDDAGDADSAEDPFPAGVRFLDYDYDKRTDWVQIGASAGSGYPISIKRNTPNGFVSVAGGDDVAYSFAEEPGAGISSSFSDMNGDGLLEPARVDFTSGTRVSYQLSLGFGRWTPETSIELTVSDGADLSSANVSLEDLNGDGVDDVVAVLGRKVWIFLNRNDGSFDPSVVIGTSGADIEIPNLPSNDAVYATVLFADMNANGSTDVVWINSDNEGEVQYLELFPVRPNLLARIENGLGRVQQVTYQTTAEQAKAAELSGRAWTRNLQQPINVVATEDLWEKLSGRESGGGLHTLTSYQYANGYYDGTEKTFLGFSNVEVLLHGGATQESILTKSEYDSGVDDYYRKGKLLREEAIADPKGTARTLSATSYAYDDCPLSGIDAALEDQVRHVCEVATETVLQEGLSQERWVTLRSESEYDGYGNVILARNFGDTSRDGDESFAETSYIAPGASSEHPWMLNLESSSETYGNDQTLRTRQNTYYDGDAFVGLAAGKVTQGNVTRTELLVREGEYIPGERNRYDEHGNVVETMDPRGSVENTSSFRRVYEMDRDGLKVTSIEILLEDEAGEPYTLRQEVSYHQLYNLPVETTGWVVYRGGEAVTPRAAGLFEYDEHQRPVKIAQPGDTLEFPSQEIEYELGDPVTRTVVRQRSEAGGATDIETIRCTDGQGRTYQTRTLLANGNYTVTGLSEFNERGTAVRTYQPYESESSACDQEAPGGVLMGTELLLDGAGRTLRETRSDGAFTQTEYEPLLSRTYDFEDTNAGGRHANTPVEVYTDGLERVVRYVRYLDDANATEGNATELEYDSLGRLAAIIDAKGNRKEQEYDLLGRAVAVHDFNAATTRYEYDAAGNLTTRTDARGLSTNREYDALNRVLRMVGDGGEEVSSSYDFPIEGCDENACQWAAGMMTESTFRLADGSTGSRQAGFNARGFQTYDALHVLGQKLVTSYSYDNVNRLVEMKLPDGQKDVREYGPGGRVIAISGVASELVYDERNELTKMVLDNGLIEDMTRDDLMRLESRTITAADDTVIGDFQYTYDLNGNLTAVSNDADGEHALSEQYAYDDWYRPIEAKFSGTDYEETIDYEYDAIDNVVSRISSLGGKSAAHIGLYEYDAKRPGQVISAGGIEREYDEAGNTTRRGDLELKWEFRGLLEQIQGNDLEAEFSYSAAGVPLISRVNGSTSILVNPSFEVRDGIGVFYARTGMRRLARTESDELATSFYQDLAPANEPDGKITAADAYLVKQESADGDTRGILKSAARRMLTEARGAKVFLHQDHINSVFASTDEKGNLLGTQSFFPNGALRTQSAFVDRYGFTGQPGIEGTDLVQYKYRFFDRQTGRWLSADPLFERASAENATDPGQGLARYAYIANRGINGFDPHGLNRSRWKKFKQGVRQFKKGATKRLRNSRAKALQNLGNSIHQRASDNRRTRQLDAQRAERSRVFNNVIEALNSPNPQRVMDSGAFEAARHKLTRAHNRAINEAVRQKLLNMPQDSNFASILNQVQGTAVNKHQVYNMATESLRIEGQSVSLNTIVKLASRADGVNFKFEAQFLSGNGVLRDKQTGLASSYSEGNSGGGYSIDLAGSFFANDNVATR